MSHYSLHDQREALITKLKQTLQPEVLNAGHQVAERLVDLYLGIDQGGTFFGAVEGFGSGTYVNETFGGIKGLADYLVKGGKVQTQNLANRGAGGGQRPVLAPIQSTGSQGQVGGQNITTGQLGANTGVSQATIQPVGGGIAGPGTNLGGVDTSGLPPELQALLSTIQQQLDELRKRGEVINPNLQITPEKLQEFTLLASQQLDPYFSSQLKLGVDSFLTDLGYAKETLLQNEQRLQQQYGIQLRGLGEQAAEQGFAQSGIRQRGERELTTQAQQQIDDPRRQLGYTSGQAARTFAQQFAGLPGYALPSTTIGQAPRVLSGEYQFGQTSGEQPLYQLSDNLLSGLVGTQENQRQASIRSLTGQLGQDYTTLEANKQLRSLTS